MSMSLIQPLPIFDPRSIPVQGIDDHLASVAPNRLAPLSLRRRFTNPPIWAPEHSV